MQFIILNGTVECPACGVILKKISEQDRRIAVMKHESEIACALGRRSFRVDRMSGYGEEFHDA